MTCLARLLALSAGATLLLLTLLSATREADQ